jgi:CheY-like chemotaxis protein/HPt (histidine-containing phosphotransfer) domain-containing protein
MRILVVEDNAINQMVALTILEKLGYTADAVANGLEAIASLGSTHYDLVFMDVEMPVMDGYSATRTIRSPESSVLNHEIIIIAMTAHAMLKDRIKSREAGMNDLMSKPISPELVAEVLNRWFGQVHGQPVRDTVINGEQSDGGDTDCFNADVLVSRCMGDESLAREVVKSYLDSSPSHVSVIGELLEMGDARGAYYHAHALNGASGTINAESMRKIAFEMEQMCTKGDLVRAIELLPHLKREYERLKVYLDQVGWSDEACRNRQVVGPMASENMLNCES